MRVKIIEGMAAGKAIVSTPVGAEGIKYTEGKNILVAETGAEFCNAIVRLLEDVDFCATVGREARSLAAGVYDNTRLGSRLLDFYQDLLK